MIAGLPILLAVALILCIAALVWRDYPLTPIAVLLVIVHLVMQRG